MVHHSQFDTCAKEATSAFFSLIHCFQKNVSQSGSFQIFNTRILTSHLLLWFMFNGFDIVCNDNSTYNFDEQYFLFSKRKKIKNVRNFPTICLVCKTTDTFKKYFHCLGYRSYEAT